MPQTLAKICGPAETISGDRHVVIAGVTADSREVEPGFLFAALPGTVVDGARFIGQALDRGAVAVLTGSDVSLPDGAEAVHVRSSNPRRSLAQMAGRYYRGQPETIVAVTGTNGKTSVVSFVRQIWQVMGFGAASLGTTGIDGPAGSAGLAHTTPDPVALHQAVQRLGEDGTSHLALEASSHGLVQHRLDGLLLSVGAFTNISRDHLDYHKDFEEYFDAKMRLFSDLLPVGAAAVINADSPQAEAVGEICKARGLRVATVGEAGHDLRLVASERDGLGQRLLVRTGDGAEHKVFLPLVGGFQASNALVAAGLVIAAGGLASVALRSLERLTGARGRLELVCRAQYDAPVFVDYAHTPDALATALDALRPYSDNKLHVVFGCGGDRDKGKRPQMGAIAADKADVIWVTDDNPRSEDPAAIREEIMAACPGAENVAGRSEAIERAVGGLRRGDVLLVAGKGHETGQTVGGETLPFSDHEAVIEAASKSIRHG